MIKNITSIILIFTLLTLLVGTPSYANEASSGNAADVVILVDFSGSITDDPRYPLAEKKALENLVNVSWPHGSKVAILAFGASDIRNGGKPATFPMCGGDEEVLKSTTNIEEWISNCVAVIGTKPVGPMTDHNKAIKKAVDILSGPLSTNSSKFVLLMTDGKLDVDNFNPVNPDYIGSSEEKDQQAIDELFLEVLPDARKKGIQIWPVGFGDVNRIELNGYAPEGGQPGPNSCQREIPRAVIAEPEDLPYEINKIIRQVTCLGEYVQGKNPEILLPDYADEATVKIKHQEGETFTLLGPNGEKENGGGEGTVSTITIPDPSGGTWQIVSDTPVEVGYWWKSTFEPIITCPEENNVVTLSVIPSNNSSDSYVNSPVFIVEVIVDGEKQFHEIELGEEATFMFQEEVVDIVAEASYESLDQPAIISFNKAEEKCSNKLLINSSEKDINNENDIAETPSIDTRINCELTPENEKCKDPIPWWLLILIGLTILTLVWYLWNKRYLREGTFVISNNLGEQGRVRVLKKTTSLAFNINKEEQFGSQITKTSAEIYGSYEITKGKKGPDFIVSGPVGSGKEKNRAFIVGDKLELEEGYILDFEDGFSRKPIIVDENPFEDDGINDIFSNPSTEEIDDENSEENPFA